MPSVAVEAPSAPPLKSPLLIILVAWLLPGAGHFWLGRRNRGLIVFGVVLLCFLLGVAMNGPFFTPGTNGDILSRFIQYAGFIGDLSSGLFYLVASFAGYGPPDQPGHAADYGAKFLVGAGVLNVLAIVDAYEIATRQKE